MIIRLAISLLCIANSVSALDLTLPRNALETASQNTQTDSYFVPTAVYKSGNLIGATIEGQVRRSVFRIASSGLTPLQVIGPLRAQLVEAGYDIVLDCADTECGGFDFRFAIETLPAPAMYVNLRGFHFVTGVQGSPEQPDRVVTLLASTAASAAHLQVIQAGALGNEPDQFTNQAEALGTVVEQIDTAPAPARETTTDIEKDLKAIGVALLSDLQFKTGSAELGDGPFDAIAALAAFLNADPVTRIAVVGHTDNVGSLRSNINLSRARAESVRMRLIDVFGIQPNRIEANGIGYLAPIASNSTEAGRNRNRRVEVVLLTGNAN